MDIIRSRFSATQQSTDSSTSASTSNAADSQTSAGSLTSTMTSQSSADGSGGSDSSGSSGAVGDGASGVSTLLITTATDSRTTSGVAQSTVTDSDQDPTVSTVTEYVIQTSGLSGISSSLSLKYTITRPAETTLPSTTTVRPVETFTTSVIVPLSSLTGTAGSSTPSNASPTNGTIPPEFAATQRKGVTSGAAAGIGIGCAVLGAIVGALLVWLLFRKRNSDRNSPDSRITPSDMDEFTSTAKAIPITSVAALPPVKQVTRRPVAAAVVHARPSTSNSVVISKMGELATHIKSHVEEFYHRDFVDSTSVDVDAIEELGLGPYEAARLVILLCSGEDRFAGMRYLMAWTLFSRLELGGDSRKTLLPPVIVDGYISVFNSVSARQRSKWRVATAELYSQKYGRIAWGSGDDRRTALRKLRSTLASILSPFVRSDRAAECLDDLDTVVKGAASLGLTLISHLSEFEFVWEDDADGELVFPGLAMVTGENGERLSSRRHLTSPVWD